MNIPPPAPGASIRDRFQWGSYGFVPGLVLGIILGWVFSGVVSWVFRFGIAVVVVLAVVMIFLAWRWLTSAKDQGRVMVYEYQAPVDRGDSIEASARVIDSQPMGTPMPPAPGAREGAGSRAPQ